MSAQMQFPFNPRNRIPQSRHHFKCISETANGLPLMWRMFSGTSHYDTTVGPGGAASRGSNQVTRHRRRRGGSSRCRPPGSVRVCFGGGGAGSEGSEHPAQGLKRSEPADDDGLAGASLGVQKSPDVSGPPEERPKLWV